ncbi:MAG: hydroxysqualene dehydroxylase HpnE [Melioribacteraceae bacterium]|nr:hydroxysqualene dehydroxylase HpnE [Melioribacteraceae bacterium]
MPKCLVIGGGIAGLSAAVHLSRQNIEVTLLEASPKLGGRAYSYWDNSLNIEIDNGQHIMMSCYHDTIEFLKIIGARENIYVQDYLSICYKDKSGKEYFLNADKMFYPFNLIIALLRFDAIPILNRISILSLLVKIKFGKKPKAEQTVKEWLLANKQSESSIKYFWEIIAIGTLNTNIDDARALLFFNVLNEIFNKGNANTKIIIPKIGLSRMYSDDAKKFIELNGGNILFPERVLEIKTCGDNVCEVITTQKSYTDFDFIISSIPYFAVEKLNANLVFPEELMMNYSPIITIHIVLRENNFSKKFYGLFDSKLHWVFNNGTHLSVVSSAADELNSLTPDELAEYTFSELEKFFIIFQQDLIVDYKVIREKRATFKPGFKTERQRTMIRSNYNNFDVAGDWANTGLPATIEGAVRSGKSAAERLMKKINGNSLVD